VVHRLHPEEFNKQVVDPWAGVAMKRRVKKVKPAARREQVHEFAWGCVERGRPEPAAAYSSHQFHASFALTHVAFWQHLEKMMTAAARIGR
jgi:hypothetical protein